MILDKDDNRELMRKYKVNGFPSFFYIKPNSNAHTSTEYNDKIRASNMKKWMIKMIHLHGGHKITNEYDDPTFEEDDDEDDELSSKEDTFDDVFISQKNFEMPNEEIDDEDNFEDNLELPQFDFGKFKNKT